jgi:hypothetical protein
MQKRDATETATWPVGPAEFDDPAPRETRVPVRGTKGSLRQQIEP